METLNQKNGCAIKKKCLINNVVLFVMSYLIVFYVVQIAIILSAFTHGVPMVLYTHDIDFNSVNTAASGEVWTSSDNVIAIFGMPIIAVFILGMTSILLLTRWITDKIQIKRFLFWIFICSFVRLSGNFVVGHISHLWNVNLVTDFMGITYPGNLGKILFVIVVLLLTAAGFYWSASLIKYIVNPYSGRLKEKIVSNVFAPAIIGLLIVNLFFIPYAPAFTWLELGGSLFILLGMLLILVPVVLKRYKFIEDEENELVDDEKINIPLLLFVVGAMIALKVIFDQGVFLNVSPYRNYFLENVILIACGVIVSGFLLYLWLSYRRKEKKKKIATEQILEEIESFKEGISDEEWGVKKYDLSKYNDFPED